MLTTIVLMTLLAADPRVVYVNFGPVDIDACPQDDPETNCLDENHTLPEVPAPPFSIDPMSALDAAREAAIVAVARLVYADFGIRFTDVRPEAGTGYDMILVGLPNPPPAIDHDLQSAIDCDDAAGPQLGFLWWTPDPDSSRPITHYGNDLAHISAFGWGLEITESTTDLMGQGQALWDMEPIPIEDECYATVDIDGDGSPVPQLCNEQHMRYCPDVGLQNTLAELMDILGPSEPDLEPPVLEIVHPEDGAIVEPNFDLVLAVSDNQSPQLISLVLTLDGTPQDLGDFADPELTLAVEDLTPGEHTLLAEATDEDGNSASDEVTFTVGDVPDTGTGTGSGTGSGDDSAGDGADSSGGDAAGDGSSDGCSCSTSLPANGSPLFALLLLAGRRRRIPR